MKIAIISTCVFCSFLIFTNGGVSAQRTFYPVENRLLDTVSLSFNGNLYLSRAIDGIWKIIDGLFSCKFIDPTIFVICIYLFKVRKLGDLFRRVHKNVVGHLTFYGFPSPFWKRDINASERMLALKS